MVIDLIAAKVFTEGYKSLLIEVHQLSKRESRLKLVETLSVAREAVVGNPSLIHRAAASLGGRGSAVPEEVLRAAESLEVRRWIYLRDTTKVSIFMDPECENAYGVLGLNDPLCEILGGTGALVRTGIVHFRGAFVCDGILANAVWLGTNYKKEFSAKFAELKKAGRFYTG